MIGLLQRVVQARVDVNGETIAAIGKGLMVLVGVEKNDTETQADRLLERLRGYRVFEDTEGRMNLSLTDIEGDLLLVPQFTLPADTRKGMRPSFTPAADPQTGKTLFNYLVEQAKQPGGNVQTGKFGANMQVHLINDGPVTFWLQTRQDASLNSTKD